MMIRFFSDIKPILFSKKQILYPFIVSDPWKDIYSMYLVEQWTIPKQNKNSLHFIFLADIDNPRSIFPLFMMQRTIL